MSILILIYIIQASIVLFSNEAVAYIPKKNKSKVWLWLSSKINALVCSLCQ